MAALAGTGSANLVMRGGLIDPKYDIRPQGVVTLYPPVDLLQLDTLLKKQGCKEANHDLADSFESRYLGGPLQSMKDAAVASNPITYIDELTPPFFVQNGSKDCMVGVAQSLLLVDFLRERNIPVVYSQLKSAGHGGKAFETKENAENIMNWVKETLGITSSQ